MSEGMVTATALESVATPGQILRQAREAQGIELDALAAMLKVPPSRLRALEADRYDELQGPTFVRALALTACRALKVEPNLLLDELPKGFKDTLIHVDGGLNEPFRTRHREAEAAPGWRLFRPVHGLGLALLVGAGALFWLPPQEVLRQWWPFEGTASSQEVAWPVSMPAPEAPAVIVSPHTEPAPSSAASAASAAGRLQQAVPVDGAAPIPVVAQAGSVSAEVAPVAPVVVKTRDVSWVEIIDAREQVLLARNLAAGEMVALSGAFPLRVRVGNVHATELSLRGKPVDLSIASRDNVARLELN